MLSLDMFTSRAFSAAKRRRGFMLGSAPPMRAATVISRIRRVKTLPLLASVTAFLCLILAHLECPAMIAASMPLEVYNFSIAPVPAAPDNRQFHASAAASRKFRQFELAPRSGKGLVTTSSYRAWGIALALVGVLAFSVRPI